jgi:hypothetical protein
MELDLLVDGELADDERRALLARLGRAPDGWRRCALAFLEAQTLRVALGELARSAAPAPAPASPAVRRSPWPRRALVAAALVAAFGFGFASRRPGLAPVATGPVVVTPSATGPEATRPTATAPRPVAEPEVQTVGLLAIGDPGRDGDPVFNVPVVAGPGIDERWLEGQAPALSDYDRQHWQRLGFDVEERRELVSVDLRDGRRVSVPVDRVRLRYVARPPL